MKRYLVVAAVVIGCLLTVAGLIAAYRQPSALDVARGQCMERGYQAEDLQVLGYEASHGLSGAIEVVKFQVRGAAPPKKLVVHLKRPAYVLPWKVVDLREEEEKE